MSHLAGVVEPRDKGTDVKASVVRTFACSL